MTRRLPMAAIVLGLALSACPDALALNPALDINQYAHTSWKVRDGFFKGFITSFAQTDDGYLWLGSDFGLMRFDGVRFVPWDPPSGQSLPSNYIRSLLAARDGTLWIGTLNGLASWKNRRLTVHPDLDGQAINALVEDRQGIVWIGGAANASPGRLCTVRRGAMECDRQDSRMAGGVWSLYEDRAGRLWVETATDLWRWSPGPPTRSLVPVSTALENLAEDDDGALLVGLHDGVRRVAEGNQETAYQHANEAGQFSVIRLRRDRDGGVWIGTQIGGLLHVHQGKTDRFSDADGLSGVGVNRLFEDREGNIWVATDQGLDRFRELAVTTMTARQGLSGRAPWSIAASADGVWLGTSGGFDVWKDGRIGAHGGAIIPSWPRDESATSLFQGPGRLWVATNDALWSLQNDRLMRVASVPPPAAYYQLAEDAAGSVWIAGQRGLAHWAADRRLEEIPWARLGFRDVAMRVVADHVRGGVWLGFYRGGIAHLVDGQIRASYGTAEGLGHGRVSDLQWDRDGALWVATEGGLSRLKDGRIHTMNSKNGLPCDGVHWRVADDRDSVWLFMVCGLVRVASADLDGWIANPERTIQASVFDASDGVRLQSAYGNSGYTPTVAKADGRVWFIVRDGVSILDPGHLPFNRLPPPVAIESITADRTRYDASDSAHGRTRLPSLVRDLQIDYTALSLVVPEKNRFRYKLEGYDRDWQDAGNRRQAFYTHLPPRDYRFRVVAANNSGVWNETGASLDFTVLPAYYQTAWFRVTAVAVFVALLGTAYQLRVRQLARHYTMRLDARVSERTRIARDLHDTLLQNFQGVLLNFQAAAFLLRSRPDEGHKTLEDAIERASQAITEARDAVQGLRASAGVTGDLARAIGALGEDLTDRSNHHAPEFTINIEGEPQDLTPILGDEVYRIAGEALRNAFRHANARQIEVEIHYDRKQFRLRIRDDGKGIDPNVLATGGRNGHYGLAGMHERAAVVGGTLEVWSELADGTEIELTIPAAIAYAKSAAARADASAAGAS